MKTKSITKVTLLSIFILSVIAAVTLNSCQKEIIKPKPITKSTGASNLNATATLAVNEVNNLVFSMHKNAKGLVPGGLDSNGCVIITTDTIAKPYKITYDYGSGCICTDGKVRSGVVLLTYNSQDIRQVNSVVSANMQGYSVAGKLINGTISITNTGYNGNNNLVLVETGNISTMTSNQLNPDTIVMNYSYEWLAGESASPASNLQFSVNGGWVGSYGASQSDSMVITTPLIKNSKTPGCNYYIQGTCYTVTLTALGAQYTYIDFGNPGGCTGQYASTQNGVTTTENQ